MNEQIWLLAQVECYIYSREMIAIMTGTMLIDRNSFKWIALKIKSDIKWKLFVLKNFVTSSFSILFRLYE